MISLKRDSEKINWQSKPELEETLEQFIFREKNKLVKMERNVANSTNI